jgi:tetratricopeptide (TPR) repeat protein
MAPDFADPWVVIAVLSNVVTLLGTIQWFRAGIKNKDSEIRRLGKALDEMETDRDVWKQSCSDARARAPEAIIETLEKELGDGHEGLAHDAVKAWIKTDGTYISRLLLFQAEWANKHAAGRERSRGLLAAEVYATAACLFDADNESAATLRERTALMRQKEGEPSPPLTAATSFDGHLLYDPDAELAANEAEAEARRVLRLGLYQLALEKVEAALDLRSRSVGPNALSNLRTRSLRSQILMPAYAVQALREIEAVIEAQQENLAVPQDDIAEAHFVKAQVLERLGVPEKALEEARFVLDVLEASSGYGDQSQGRRFQARTLIAELLNGLKRYDESLAEAQAILSAEKEAALPSSNEIVLRSRHIAARSLCDLRRFDAALLAEATAIVKDLENVPGIGAEGIPEADPDLMAARILVCDILSGLRKYDDAIRSMREVITNCSEAFGPSHPQTFTTRQRLASLFRTSSRFEDAYREMAALVRDQETSNLIDGKKLWNRFCLAVTLVDLNRFSEARAAANKLLADQESKLGADHPDTIMTRQLIADIRGR